MDIESIIQCGLTQVIHRDIPEWYKGAEGQAEMEYMKDWDELIGLKTTYDVIMNYDVQPFYRYMVRYLLMQYQEEYAREGLMDSSMSRDEARRVVEKIYEDIRYKTKHSRERDLLFRLVREDFQGLEYTTGSGRNNKSWDDRQIKELLFGVNHPKDSVFLQFALGMNMGLEDVDIFLKKVLNRAGLSFWNLDDVLTYICICYVPEEKLRFCMKARKAYQEAEAVMPPILGGQEQDARTQVVEDFLSMSMNRILDRYGEEGFMNITDEFREFLSYYKFLLDTVDHDHSANQAFLKLWEEFKEAAAEDIDNWKDDGEDARNRAEGQIKVYYDAADYEIDLRKGMPLKGEGEDHTPSSFYVAEDTFGERKERVTVEIPVVCVREALFDEVRERYEGEVPKHSSFVSEDRSLSQIENISSFKINKSDLKKAHPHISGKVYALCSRVGRIIPAGTGFTYNDRIRYESTEDVDTSCYIQVKVVGEKDRIGGALKDSLRFIREIPGIKAIRHKRISLNAVIRGGALEYLYGRKSAGRAEDEKNYVRLKDRGWEEQNIHLKYLQESILKGKGLTNADLSQIKHGYRMVKREELMTVAFLVEMAKSQFSEFFYDDWEDFYQEYRDLKNEQDRKDYANDHLREVLANVNQILTANHFYPMYMANPYDRILAYLTTCEEPLSAYRNMWSLQPDQD